MASYKKKLKLVKAGVLTNGEIEWFETWDEECERNERTSGTQQWAETYSDNLGESPDY